MHQSQKSYKLSSHLYILSLYQITQKDVMKYVHQEVRKPELGGVRRLRQLNLCSCLQKRCFGSFEQAFRYRNRKLRCPFYWH